MVTNTQFPPLTIEVCRVSEGTHAGCVVVRMSGGVCGTGGLPLVRQWPDILTRAESRLVFLDLSGVSHLAGTASGLFRVLSSRAQDQACKLNLVGVNLHIQDQLVKMGIGDDVINTIPFGAVQPI